jgi:hypothetical protein
MKQTWVFAMVILLSVFGGEGSRATPSAPSAGNQVSENEAERLSITIDQTECPEKCIKSNNRCDLNCRTRHYAELNLVELINVRESLALARSTPTQVQVIDQKKFCAKETVQFKTPSGVLSLVNPQAYKGEFSDHSVCTASHGYVLSLFKNPDPTPTTPVDEVGISSDGCYEVVTRRERAIYYESPSIVGPLRYTCKEDDKSNSVKTVSWQLTKGCSVSWVGTVKFTGASEQLSSVQVGCWAQPSGGDGNSSDGNGW